MPQADADPMAAKGNHSPATGNVVSSIHQRMQQQSRPSPAPNVVECPSLSDTSVVSRRTTSGETHSRRSRMCEPVKRAEVERSSASAFVAGADSVLRAQLTGQSEQLAALANRQAAPNLPFSPGPFPFFPWMQMQPFGPAAVPPAQPTLMDAATARAYANAYPWENFMMTAKAENERRGVDGTSPTWRVGSAGGYVPRSPFYPIPVPALWYGSAAAAVAVANDGAKNAALPNAGSRPNSPRSKKRTFDETSISPTSDRSTVMDFIRHSPTSLFHNSGVNSRSSSAASIGSFGHLAVGPVNPALSHFRGSPVMGPFGAVSPPFPLFMPSPFGVSKPELTPTAPMNGHTSPYSCFGFPFPNGPIVTNFHPAGASLPFPTMGYPISVVPDAKEAKAVASVDEKPMDKGAGGLDKAGDDDEEETIEMEKTQSRSREPSGSSIDVDVDGPVVKEELVDIKEEPVDTNCRWIGCGLPFATQADLVRHVSLAHVESTQEGFVCRWSSCDRGGKAFKAKYMLSVHMRRHTGDKPHVCSIEGCGKAYSRLENLKTHLRSHTGDKPYTCEFPGCGKSFTNASDRAKHESRTHSDQKRYVCGYPGCTSKYTDPSSLRKHVKTKHGDEAFLKKKHKPSEPDSGGGTMNTHEPGNTDPSSMTGSGGKVGFVIRTESTGYSNPGSNQTTIGSVDSPITNSTSNTDGQCSSVSPFHTDSGVEMSTPSDNMSALIEHVLQASEAENEDLAARMVATVSGFGNDEENDGVADDLASHVQRVRRRMAAKANLATVYAGDVVASKVDRVAEYVSEQSRLYGNSYRPTCNIRPPAQDIGMTTIQLPTKTLVSVSYRPHKPSQILTAGGSCTSATSSDYGSLHSAGTTATSYPSSVLSSPGASRPDSVMSYASQQTPNYAEMGYSPALSQCPRSSQGFGPMGHHRQQEDVWNGANLRSPRHVGCGSYNFPNECSSGCCCVHGQNRRNELADPETMRRMSEYARRMRKDDTDDGGYPRSDWAKSRWLAQEGSTVDGVDRQWARSVGCPHAHRRSDRDVAYDRPGTAVQITSSPSPPCCSQHYQRNGAGGALRQAPVQCGNYQQPQLPHLNQQQSPHPHLQQSRHLRHQPPMFRSPRPAVNGVTYGMESAPRNVLEVEVLDLMNGVKEIDIGRSGGNTITTGQQSNCAYSFENITLADMASNLASFIKENRSFHTR